MLRHYLIGTSLVETQNRSENWTTHIPLDTIVSYNILHVFLIRALPNTYTLYYTILVPIDFTIVYLGGGLQML